MKNGLIQIDFHGEPLWAMSQDGDVFVAIKPISEALGVDWNAQYQRIKRDAVMVKGMCVIHIPSGRGHQQAVCLPLKLLNGWLFGIDDSRIADEAVRAKVILYKTECYDVLFQHFHGKAQSVVYSDPDRGELAAHPLAAMFPLLPAFRSSRSMEASAPCESWRTAVRGDRRRGLEKLRAGVEQAGENRQADETREQAAAGAGPRARAIG